MNGPKGSLSKWKFKDLPKSYGKLVAWYAPRPIRNQAELEAATAVIDAMAGHDLTTDQDDYLDLVSTLVSDYEEQHDPVSTKGMSPVETLKYFLEEAGMSAADFGRILGNRELGAKILRGDRELTVEQIALLAERFAVSAELFMPRSRHSKSRPRAKTAAFWRSSSRTRLH